MSGARLLPLVGLLAMMAIAPGVLGECGFGHGGNNSQPPTFTTQTTPTPPSPIALVSFILIPVGVILGALAIARRTVAPAVTGQWVATPAQWVWVENKK